MNLTDIEKLHKQGKIRGFKVAGQASKGEGAVNKLPSTATSISPVGLEHIKQVLRRKGLVYMEEFKFLSTRKFRFDLALPAFMLGLEYEGIYSKKSRHTTVSGYAKDTQKYNLAVCAGWTVLRYTASNYKDFENNLIEFLMNKR